MKLAKSFLIGMAVAGWVVAGSVIAQSRPEVDDALVERVKQAVLEALRDSGELDRAIDEGIERFVARQRAERAAREAAQRRRLAEALPAVDPSRDHVFGDPGAPVSLIEYSDFECPFCKRFHPTAEAFVEANPGQVNWVYRHFPLGFHNPAAQREAEASECVAELAGNDAFWRYAASIYAATPSNGEGVPADELDRLAAVEGVASREFTACLESERHAERIRQDLSDGQAAGVTGTPGNFLRDNRTGRTIARPGAVDLEQLQRDLATLTRSGQ